jgi:hypothetical protein
MRAGRPLLITGLFNKIMAYSAGLSPSSVSLFLASRMNVQG